MNSCQQLYDVEGDLSTHISGEMQKKQDHTGLSPGLLQYELFLLDTYDIDYN